MQRPEEAQRPYTVTELANEIRRELRPLTALLVKGEVSGMKRGASGHFNFSIQDGVSKLEAVLFAEGPTAQWALPLPEPVTGAPAGLQRFVFALDGLPPGEKPDGAILRITAVSGDRAVEVAFRLD